MDRTQSKKKSHQSKFLKQFCYYSIVFSLQMRSVSGHNLIRETCPRLTIA